ncbi:hypothetical protein U3516DRAFT_784701 [Neocallimastix sp. 'constans']
MLFVYCKNKWSKIKSDELLPGEYMMGFNDLMNDFEEDVPIIELGDVSIASPFTSKISSVISVVVFFTEFFNAYSLSVLYLVSIKQGDWQAIIAINYQSKDHKEIFSPSLLNSANHESRPFRESICENKALFNTVGLELSPSLNEKMQ